MDILHQLWNIEFVIRQAPPYLCIKDKERLSMANFKNINIRIEENILTIQIDRQDKHNALSTLLT